MLLQDKIAVVTGASRGIGRATAKALAREGAMVIVNYNGSKERADEVVSEIEKDGGKAKAIQCNVSDFEQAKEFFGGVVKEYGRIDILVNNAGITRDNLIMKMSEEEFQDVIQTNLAGVFNGIKFVTRPMMKQRQGHIINMASVSGIIGNMGQANYSASKAGMIALAKSIAQELGSRGIRANAIAPGFIMTAMTDALSEEVKAEWCKKIPLRRGGTPEDVANIATFLASDMSSYVSGQVIQVDGGMNM